MLFRPRILSGSGDAMLQNTIQARTRILPHPPSQIGKDNREFSSSVFVVTDDELLGSDVVTFVEACGFLVKWFRSACGYLAHKRSQVPSCLLVSSRLSDMSGFDFQRTLSGNEHPPIIFLSDD